MQQNLLSIEFNWSGSYKLPDPGPLRPELSTMHRINSPA